MENSLSYGLQIRTIWCCLILVYHFCQQLTHENRARGNRKTLKCFKKKYQVECYTYEWNDSFRLVKIHCMVIRYSRVDGQGSRNESWLSSPLGNMRKTTVFFFTFDRNFHGFFFSLSTLTKLTRINVYAKQLNIVNYLDRHLILSQIKDHLIRM